MGLFNLGSVTLVLNHTGLRFPLTPLFVPLAGQIPFLKLLHCLKYPPNRLHATTIGAEIGVAQT